MEFRVLGPLEVLDDGRPVPLGGGKESALLALLLLRSGEIVSIDSLTDALWGGRPPTRAPNSIHVYISHLRRAVGPDRLARRGRGYVLEVEADELDRRRFEQLVSEARELRAAGRTRDAAATLTEALALWRGPLLEGLGHEDFARAEVARLEELRLGAFEDHLDLRLEAGEAADLVAELEALVHSHPFREHLRVQLMLALYRSGRQAEALAAYREGQRALRGELGLEPGPELQQLERAILRQDPGLARAGGSAWRRPRRAGLAVGVGAVLLLVVAVGAAVELDRRAAPGLAAIAPNSLAVVDEATGRLTAQVSVGVRPGPVAFGAGSIWVANLDDRTISRIDPAAHSLLRTIAVPGTPAGLAYGGGKLWVSTIEGGLYRVDPRFDGAARFADVSYRRALLGDQVAGVTVGLGGVWIADRVGLASKVSAASGRIATRVQTGYGANGIAVGAGAVWVANAVDGTVTRIDPSGATTTIPVGHEPTAIAVGAGSIWVADSLDGTLVRIAPDTNGVVATIPVGPDPVALAVTASAVWVAVAQERAVKRVDPASNRVVASIPVANRPQGLALAGSSVWVSVAAQAPPSAGPAGGVARVEVADDPGALDPAVYVSGGSPQFVRATCTTLMGYADETSPQGAQLVPEAALSAPLVSADRRRYTFVVRGGLRFSPPSNEPVTARTFKYAIERSLSPRIASPNVVDISDVLGVDAYRARRSPHINGLIARGDKLTVVLRRPAGNLPARLSTLGFCAVPIGTPVDLSGATPVSAAGPYYVSSYTPGQKLVLSRNPHYRGNRPHRLSAIEVSTGVAQAQELTDVRAGIADYAAGGVPIAADPMLRARYGPGSAGAGKRAQYYVGPALSLRMFVLNTSRPLFSDPRLRRVVAFAIDRRRLADEERRFWSNATYGGGKPTDAYLPEGVPGAPRGHVYPLDGPDLSQARLLADGTRHHAVLFTCNAAPCPQQAAILQANLHAVGIGLEIHEFPKPVLYARASVRGAPYDILALGWSADYPDAATFLGDLLGADRIGTSANLNWSYFDDPVFGRRLRAAAKLVGPRRTWTYAALARDLAQDASPLLPFSEDESRDFFSARIGCQAYQPVYGIDLAALCIKRGA